MNCGLLLVSCTPGNQSNLNFDGARSQKTTVHFTSYTVMQNESKIKFILWVSLPFLASIRQLFGLKHICFYVNSWKCSFNSFLFTSKFFAAKISLNPAIFKLTRNCSTHTAIDSKKSVNVQILYLQEWQNSLSEDISIREQLFLVK